MRLRKPDLLREIVERHGLPFATSTMAKGLIDDEHPLAIGCIERACRQIQWAVREPRTFLITNGWSSMGFGIPAAIAAKLARPERPVVALVGDGCFQMTCGELAVAQRLGLAVAVVVLDDAWLSLIRVKQLRRGLEVYGRTSGASGAPHRPRTTSAFPW